MVQVVDEHLAKAIVDIAIFLEVSDENTVDGDAAVAAMEQLSAELQRMSVPAKADLAQRFREMAPVYGDRAQFVGNLADSLGIG
jgi:hypothetical protein